MVLNDDNYLRLYLFIFLLAMTLRFSITKNDLNTLDLSKCEESIVWCPTAQYFNKQAGSEHYRLFAYISKCLPKNHIVLDIGTFYGMSAASLAYNENIHVKTYDIYDSITDEPNVMTIRNVNNIEYLIKDCCDDLDVMKSASIIVLDVDPHDGVQEREIVQNIRESGFKGVLICDDIHLNDGMRSFWNDIPEPKKDVTPYGHWSGTGIVFFSNAIDISFE